MDLLHIGGDAMVDTGEVIAIVSRETAMRSRDTRRAIDAAIGSGRIRSVSDAPEKSYVLLERDGAFSVWPSPIAAETLLKRAAGGMAEQLADANR
ncbi:MAG: DUF370 domain-containing protein [bacterium]|nr:DUF370 domain-containing protein [bacterium]